MHRMWRWIGFVYLVGFTGTLWAQHIGQTGLFMQDKYGYNPAYGGMERSLAMGLHYRTQWAGLPGNPEYRALTGHMPMYIWGGGIGFQLTNEEFGAERQTGFSLSYNYVIQSTIGVFSVGLRPGILQKRLDGTALRAPEGFYEGNIIDHLDGNLPNGVASGIAPVLDAGVYYVGDRLEAGLSMIGYIPGGLAMGESVRYSPVPAFLLSGEYRTDLTESMTLYPGIMVRTDLAQVQAEGYVRADWNNTFQAKVGYRGFSARSVDALSLAAGFRLSPRFVLHYGYEITLSGLAGSQQGTHEVLLRYNLGQVIGAGLPPRVIYNPRNL